MSSERKLKYLWFSLGTIAVVLDILCFVYIGEKTFAFGVAQNPLAGARAPSYGLILALGLAINAIFYISYRLEPTSPLLPRLNIPDKKYWLASPERREILISRLRRLIGAAGSWINFLIATTLYMSLHYFYPQIPCPRHLLMILIWLVLSVLFGVYAFLQFRRPQEPGSTVQ